MSVRATKTTLAFGLVECPIALYKVTGEPEKPPKFEKAGPNGGRLQPRQEAETTATHDTAVGALAAKSDPLAEDPAEAFAQSVAVEEEAEDYLIEEDTGVHVPLSEVRRGIRDEDGTFTDLTDQLEEIADRTKLEEMRVADFIRTEEVRRERVLGAYFVAPDGPGAGKVLALLHHAMRETKRVAVVKFTKRSKQTLAVLIPHAQTGSLQVIELAWAEDVREAPAKCYAPAQAQVTDAEIATTVQLIEAMAASRANSLDVQVDDTRGLLQELVESAETGATFTVPARPEVEQGGADVIDLIQRGIDNPDELAAAAA
jgi:non-homologous end joining protein Ku